MTQLSPKPCATPRCPNLVRGRRARRCASCTGEAEKERGSSDDRGYGSRWRKLRALIMAQDSRCRPCLAAGRLRIASEVDHLVPKSQGGKDEIQNLQPICRACHRAKSAKEGACASRNARA